MKNSDFDYEKLFELSPDLLCIAGFDGYFKKVNSAVSKVLGYSLEELYSKPINDFIYPEDVGLTTKARENLRDSKALLYFDNRYVTKSGEIIWLSWTSQPSEEDQLIFAIAKNITHKKRLEAERNTEFANLAKMNESYKQLTYTTSHDLRSPLDSLLSIFKLIDLTKINDEKTIELIEILKRGGEKLKIRLDQYIDNLSGRNSLTEEVTLVSFEENLTKVQKSISSLIQDSRITIHSDFSRLEYINFNKSYMESVFLNLISNAIKYARQDVPPVLSIYSEKVSTGSRLIFHDNGQGIDLEKVKDRIFGLHQTFHDHTNSKGIGLYLVHTHLTSLGAKIEVESKVNEGTKFTISFK
ncbi:PAS domain S-box protein [Marivirga sp. S37H4]|uniref:histidine kinase n=1 Tax=Marivirga aurantiaca TaxID=2802615 RepID=A0A935C748_9BACT|nr:PAS domain-containing sensor histidine kinase [Marivirga aurantiaca]MBK6264147.1 PAS domain S-box protein [Marivirga aurantiaca]